ncbi:hypothetical protein AUEXF2481DRAFT_456583 [Aureobasidium subglaciale EXF-2481]|uniref:Uncharacterized protein n=1 Tax=Aureobasidium subglaciale (strain EXF-2481) TaxID=1043005 RepID=A0A074YXV0_AURSE|nr:uncharacterized protein AUEXF2481DRAFT_456583 [Aureobasidium subglaciale EXF-2481]KEQ91666.1 hypothetical protein AUEXF2481DRAFT_456583 [Aureobasidium subglaciale EXF-2481]
MLWIQVVYYTLILPRLDGPYLSWCHCQEDSPRTYARIDRKVVNLKCESFPVDSKRRVTICSQEIRRRVAANEGYFEVFSGVGGLSQGSATPSRKRRKPKSIREGFHMSIARQNDLGQLATRHWHCLLMEGQLATDDNTHLLESLDQGIDLLTRAEVGIQSGIMKGVQWRRIMLVSPDMAESHRAYA